VDANASDAFPPSLFRRRFLLDIKGHIPRHCPMCKLGTAPVTHAVSAGLADLNLHLEDAA